MFFEILSEIVYRLVKGTLSLTAWYFEMFSEHPFITLTVTIIILRNVL